MLSLDHHGQNYIDGYHPEGLLFGWERPRDISLVLDTIYADVAPTHVSVAGFSLGGYTAVAVAGARIDHAMVEAIRTGAVPIPPIEEFPDALERVRESIAGHALTELVERPQPTCATRVPTQASSSPLEWAPCSPGRACPRSRFPLRFVGAVRIPPTPFAQDVRPLLDHIPDAHGHEVGPDISHPDVIAALTPSRTAVRARVAADTMQFFVRHLPATRGI